VRRASALQAWHEWQPVREQPFLDSNIYRTFKFGNLADLIILDTRLAGRSQPVAPTSPQIADPSRSLLGVEQESWLYRELSLSQSRRSKWRLLGQQVMMAALGEATGAILNSDQWDGYLASRTRLLRHLADGAIDNVVVLTGDIHTSWGNEIGFNPFVPEFTSQAVEFVTPGITSPGIDDFGLAANLAERISDSHPHVRYVDLYRRGYLLVDIDRDRTQAEWYHMATVTQRSAQQDLGRALVAVSGSNRLTAVSSAGSTPIGSAPLAPSGM
jgi:alkaline phosphatase D